MTQGREAVKVVQSVCCEFFEQGVRYFLPDAVLRKASYAPSSVQDSPYKAATSENSYWSGWA